MSKLLRRLILSVILTATALSGAGQRPVSAAAAQADGPQLLNAGAASLVFDLRVPQPAVQAVAEGEGDFQRLALPGYEPFGEPGQPELLQRGVLIGVPAEGAVRVRILHDEVELLPGLYTLAPAPAWEVSYDPLSGRADPQAGVQERFVFDADAYATDALRPLAVVSVDEVGFIRQQRVARILLRPVQYNPASGQVRVHRYLRVEVSFAAPEPEPATPAGEAAPDAFDPLLRRDLLNYEQARAWRAPRRPAQHAAAAQSAQPWLKMTVRQSGLFKITMADLLDAGFADDSGLNPALLQVWKDGQQLAADFLGDDDARFEKDEALIFFAWAQPTLFSRDVVYWLTLGNEPGLRMAVVDGSPQEAAPEASLLASVHREEDRIFRWDIPRSDEPDQPPRWYWAELYNLLDPSINLHANLPNAITADYDVTMRIRLMGVTYLSANPDHHVAVEVNGQHVGDVIWDGQTSIEQEIEFPASALAAGLNTFRFYLPGDLPGVFLERAYLDWFSLSYRRTATQADDLVEFEAEGDGMHQFELSGFHDAAIRAYDVTQGQAPQRVVGLQVLDGRTSAGGDAQAQEWQASALAGASAQTERTFLPLVGMNVALGRYQVRFGLELSGAHAFVVAPPERIRPILRLVGDNPSSLRSPDNQADYLLITHSDLSQAAQTLADHRQSMGLDVALIDVQDVYDEFSDGQMDPNAIQEFVDYAYHHWQAPAPAFVLLFGDGHYDYRMTTAQADFPNFIPPYYDCFDPWVCEVASDNEYVAVSGLDRMPDLAIGRLPASSVESAERMVAKIIGYEAGAPPGAWRNTFTFVADNAYDENGQRDRAGHFENLSEAIVDLLPAAYSADRVYYDPYPDDDNGESFRHRTAAATTQAILNSVNDGRLFVNYVGHAGYNVWAHEWLLIGAGRTRDDVAQMVNASKLPIVLDMACVSGNFADVVYAAMEETLLDREGGGSVAGWGATGFGVATGHDKLHRGFYTAIFQDGVSELGLATVAGKLYLWQAGASPDLLDTFGLLGDPALRIQLPVAAP